MSNYTIAKDEDKITVTNESGTVTISVSLPEENRDKQFKLAEIALKRMVDFLSGISRLQFWNILDLMIKSNASAIVNCYETEMKKHKKKGDKNG